MGKTRLAVFTAALAAALLMHSSQAGATRYGPLEITGSLETQNIFRHGAIDEWDFIQQRNTLRFRTDLRIMENHKGRLGLDIPGVDNMTFLMLYRPVYDSIYDIRPGGRREAFPWTDANRDGDFGQFTDEVRDAERESNAGLNAFREVYVDIEFDVPLTLRLGKQQVVWGESDQFRMLDRVNPLDLTWHLSIEPFEKIRKPLWMAKGLYSFGSILGLTDVFIEGYWGLGDWTPGEQKFLPYPWSSPVPNPFINPATCTDPNNPFTCQQFGFVSGVPFRQGDYDSDPIDNGQWGTRIVFTTPQSIQIGLHYFYNRFNFDDSSQATFLRAVDQQGPVPGATSLNNLLLLGQGTLPAVIEYPYIHTVGISANYFDMHYTQAVLRLETIYELDLPFSDSRKQQLIVNPDCVTMPPGPTCALAPQVPSGLFGTTESDMWNGMLAFDRPTWVPFISRRNTVLFLGQLFWHYMVEDPDPFLGRVASFTADGTDKVRRWEVLSTLAATGFFGPGGTIVPLGFVGIDWANHYAAIAGYTVNYFLTPNLIAGVFQNYYFVPGYGGEVSQPWPLGGLLRERDETGLRLTWQF